MPSRLQKEDLRKRFRPVTPRKKRGRRAARVVLFLLILTGLAAVAIGLKLKKMEMLVESKFTSARRWNVPSRIYSDTEYLYPGVDIHHRSLIAKLERLAYRQVSKAIKGPGDFFAGPSTIDIYLHDFDYPLEKFSGFPVRLEFSKSLIVKMSDLDSGETLSLVRLEPEEIAVVFDAKMEDRTLLSLKEVPQPLLEAVILVEDERFFKHKGVDPIAIARAALADLLHLRLVQGGSTLTQQLIKNFFLTPEKSIRRKFNEMLMAVIIERKHTKGEILEAYLNEIYLGQRGPSSVTGAAEAAKHYFAKEVRQLTLGESALLAGMIRNPSEYSPIRNKQRAKERRNLVLKKMLDAGVIDEKAFKTAASEEIVTPKPKIKPVVAPYFIDFLKQQLAALYPQNVLETEGLKIFTTLDMTVQLEGDRALVVGLSQLERQYASILPKDHAEGLQGCVVVIAPQNGYVRAMVGGRNYASSQFNRCTQGMRQPGSTFKPFVYLTAMAPKRAKKLFTPATLVEDAPFTVQTVEGPWTPKNYDGKEHGSVTVRKALENSYNIATAKIAMEAGLDEVVQTAKDAGIVSPLMPVPSLALGAFEVTPLELAGAYAIFPSSGLRAEPLSVINVMTSDGQILEKKTLKIKKSFYEEPIALTVQLMKGVLDRGTAASARSMGFKAPAAGKTGTSSEYRDAWFVGFTPQILALVWVGYDDNVPMQMSGARAALPIWTALMKQIAGSSTQDFPFPKGIIQVDIDPDTGLEATKQCPKTFTEYFIEDTEPQEKCFHGSGKTGKPLPKNGDDF
ncbi:MAG: PBP1A family penicillin-binding protein [Deltaproteobacteria bacterium]|nr:PBP1A family penicillin-binding protein [Deltaproteobacteria bacterium]